MTPRGKDRPAADPATDRVRDHGREPGRFTAPTAMGRAPVRTDVAVTCLGLTFENDAKRLDHFSRLLRRGLEELHTKLGGVPFTNVDRVTSLMSTIEHWPMGDDTRLRALADRMNMTDDPAKDLLQRWKDEVGFPHGAIDDILLLSDPPYYTICPNPFIGKFIQQHELTKLSSNSTHNRTPYAADVSEGKTNPIYNAYSYHTKVPHGAIMRYILHYTDPGDVVFDGFCGSGMTGVAAQLCGSKPDVQALGYRTTTDGTILALESDSKANAQWVSFSKVGIRHAVLSDLSPIATFVSYNFNTPVRADRFATTAHRLISELEDECRWMYETIHTDGKTKGVVARIVWSDVFLCPDCADELIFWKIAVDTQSRQIKKHLSCSNCGSVFTKKDMVRPRIAEHDVFIDQIVRKTKQVPVLIEYNVGRQRFKKRPDDVDLDCLRRAKHTLEQSSVWLPVERLPFGGETRRNDRIGITHIHHFYSDRNLQILAALRNRIDKLRHHTDRLAALFLFTSQLSNISKLNRYRPQVTFPYNPLSGTLYVGSQISEANPFTAYKNKIAKLTAAYERVTGRSYLECCNLSESALPNSSVDYIFTDPPFGSNLSYSELNIVSEEWLKVRTNQGPEAIQNKQQGKDLFEYRRILAMCFEQYYRVLKSGRWMTVVFHNSKNSVWNAIQYAIQTAGFIVSDVRVLDKGMGTFKQVNSPGAVKKDLVISAYKPDIGMEKRFALEAGTEFGVWDFVRTHLGNLPVFVSDNDRTEVISERREFMLYDRMVAFHVRRSVDIPISAAEFYRGLEQRFPERDGMFFLDNQVAEYDKQRMMAGRMARAEIFVIDEESAIQWIRDMLSRTPRRFQAIHPEFIREIGGWQKHEQPLELLGILRENFLCYDGDDDVPSQIHSYLSTNFRDCRNLPKDDPRLRVKAMNRWYVPDANKAGDLRKLRDVGLLREFDRYTASRGRRIRVFRKEAVRAGFRRAWGERDYQTILAVAARIPSIVLQEDPKLLMWYDQAVTRSGGAAR